MEITEEQLVGEVVGEEALRDLHTPTEGRRIKAFGHVKKSKKLSKSQYAVGQGGKRISRTNFSILN